MNPADHWLREARNCLTSEAEALSLVAGRLNDSFVLAVQLILNCPGKVVVSGVGKSGIVGRKIAATLSSTGTHAVFMHPSEALHGDLGMIARGDVVIVISKSGSTAEILNIVPSLREFKCPVIGILGNMNSRLGKFVDAGLDGTVSRESDPLNIAPTASAIVAMALGDAIASALMVAKNFSLEAYSRFHPGGQLGRNLGLAVKDVMHRGDRIAWVSGDQCLKEIVIAMTRFPLGAAVVVDPEGKLSGLITDGDIRRALQKHEDIRGVRAAEIMNPAPVTVEPAVSLREALMVMENRSSQISVLPVVDGVRFLGLVRIHDIYGHGPVH